jgi:hypothetical protein
MRIDEKKIARTKHPASLTEAKNRCLAVSRAFVAGT